MPSAFARFSLFVPAQVGLPRAYQTDKDLRIRIEFRGLRFTESETKASYLSVFWHSRTGQFLSVIRFCLRHHEAIAIAALSNDRTRR